eukprot:3255231-Rhodomonas_salina.1
MTPSHAAYPFHRARPISGEWVFADAALLLCSKWNCDGFIAPQCLILLGKKLEIGLVLVLRDGEEVVGLLRRKQ